MSGLVLAVLDTDPNVGAVYSIGGGNMAIVGLCLWGRGHTRSSSQTTWTKTSTRLLRDGRISAVLHHDLRRDIRQACYAIIQAHEALPGPFYSWPSNIYIITPYNMPAPALSHP